MQSRYLEFIHTENKPKTKVWEVQSKEHGFNIGQVRYYPAWRQYSFFPYEGTIYSRECLNDIIKFIEQEEDIRKTIAKGILKVKK